MIAAPARDASPGLDGLRARLLGGDTVDPRTVPEPALAGALAVAAAAGAAAIPALDAAEQALADRAEVARAVRVASAQGKAVALGLLVLPLVLVPGLASLLDLDLVGFYRSPAGLVVGGVAAGLLAVGGLLVHRLLRRTAADVTAGPGIGGLALLSALAWVWHPLAGLATSAVVVARLRRHRPEHARDADRTVDLLATAVSGATAPGHACRIVASVGGIGHTDVLLRMALALELGRPVEVPEPFDRVLAALERSGRWGAPTAPALRRIAAELRAERRAGALASAERLPALLAFPTALCFLPASVLLVGAPLVASGLAAATGGP